MSADTDALVEATSALVPQLMTTLETVSELGRHLHPPHLDALVAAVDGLAERLDGARRRFDALPWPEPFAFYRSCLSRSAESAAAALAGLAASAGEAGGIYGAYRAMRHNTRALEALYPLTSMLPPVSRFYLEPDRRDDRGLLDRLAAADPASDDTGVMHADNPRDARGGFSMYVPEYYEPQRDWPLIVALHGGSGNGADFLWTWLRSARSRGCLLLCPTARGDTWSLAGPEHDWVPIRAMIERVCEHWRIDRSRVLLTGMSDGGTFALVAGLLEDGPVTHLAPIASSFHPMILGGADPARVEALPVYLVHGALDWMFPVEMARGARDALRSAGVALTYREIEDLSHAYPREENAGIMDWLTLTPAG